MAIECLSSGIPSLDEAVQGLRLGDNVVWQVDDLSDYLYFVAPFAQHALAVGCRLVYVRFAPHPPVLAPRPGLETVEVDPSVGFDAFSAKVHRIIEERGRGVFYVFDNLSSLVEEWATDEQLANFFQVTCPFLFELDTVTYFALLRGRHKNSAIARIRDTTQLLLEVYHAKDAMYVHPLKVWDRYSPRMFLPHLVTPTAWVPVFQSGEAATVLSTARREPLGAQSGLIAPWDSVYRQLVEYCEQAPAVDESAPEVAALRQELCRMMIGNHPEFNRLADRYLTVSDLFDVRSRMIGSGRIGGKAAGMILARRILLREKGDVDFAQVLEPHDSFYIGSDVFFTFLVNNNLFRLRLKLSSNARTTAAEFEEVEQRFLAGTFPARTMEQFREMLDYFGQAPIIVRSSSLLEDSFGNAFAGKYRSEYCPNQGDPDQRLAAFLRAVKLVYASALNPDALSYRRKRGLGDRDEQMAILVQRVSGMPYGRFFFPSLAGVAFSRNLYAWNERIDPRRGLIRLVFGLGTRAVDRVGGDYPRMIAVSHPTLRPEVGARVVKYSQHNVDVLDLSANALVTLRLADVLSRPDYPHLHLYVSLLSGGHTYDTVGTLVEAAPADLVLTFNKLIAHTDFVKVIGEILAILERVYGGPVDTEFTASVASGNHVRVNLLQCRPMVVPGAAAAEEVPEALPPERVLFRTDRLMSGGVVRGIRHIVHVDPQRYAAADLDTKRALGRLIGRINSHPRLAEGEVLLMGPGRWGSSNIELGVNVGYADIDHAAALVELACEEAGHVPEVSYGTHFFQDLVEDQVIYMAVYPNDPAAQFNAAFFARAANILPELLPGAAAYASLVRVIDVATAAGGALARVVANAETRQAICYLG
ncbi:MAG TPA: PEP/pyruvate-binding domain-containing protein [Planctomycetota bacterium]|nr:PEP/pyruvate-binding domain-containing protein [Planctomycetota bacterium]HRT93246.1 PEP/pyruvate-binding domain-containing protein [Planctomycetota bacterium]